MTETVAMLGEGTLPYGGRRGLRPDLLLQLQVPVAGRMRHVRSQGRHRRRGSFRRNDHVLDTCGDVRRPGTSTRPVQGSKPAHTGGGGGAGDESAPTAHLGPFTVSTWTSTNDPSPGCGAGQGPMGPKDETIALSQ